MKQDEKFGSYFLFQDTVMQPPRKEQELTRVHKHPITGKETPITKRDRRWHIEGINKKFRSKEAAYKFLEQDVEFLNY